jgi:hypothetical protein
VERVLSLLAQGYRGGGKNVGFRRISSWVRRRDWVSARFFLLEAQPAFLEVYRQGRRLLRENNKDFQDLFKLDVNTSEVRNRWRQREHLPNYMKKAAGKFVKTNLNIVPGMPALLVGRQSKSSSQLTAPVVNAKMTRQQMAANYGARVTERKRGRTQRQPKRQPRAKAAVVQSQPWTGKRKRPAVALPPQNKQHSNSRRSNGTDFGDEAGYVSDNH